MTKEQGWAIIAILAAIGAFLVYQHTSKGPSESEKTMMEHYRQSCIMFGTDCAEHKRLKEKYY